MPRNSPHDAFLSGYLSDCKNSRNATSIRSKVLYSYEMPIACYCVHHRIALLDNLLPSRTTRNHATQSNPRFRVARLPLPSLTLDELDDVHTDNIQHMRLGILDAVTRLNGAEIRRKAHTTIYHAACHIDALDKSMRLYASVMLPSYRFTYDCVRTLLAPEIAAIAALNTPASY